MKISIEFNKENIIHLLKATFIYSWVANGEKTVDEEDKSVNSYEQMILGLLYNSGMKEDIMFDEKENLYFTTKECEDSILELVNEYNDDTFWNSLALKLSIRDYFFQKKGTGGSVKDDSDEDDYDEDDYNQANPDEINPELAEKIKIITKFEDKYWDEFEKHGLENLKIEKPNFKIVK